MARIARVVVPGFPYHVTHRGNRRGAVFFCDDDRQRYLARLAEQSRRHGLDIWAWCLMTNHVHLIVVPQREDSMALALGRAHMQRAGLTGIRAGVAIFGRTGFIRRRLTGTTCGRRYGMWS